ncbi:MAG: cytochrome c3 family protein [Planctomycetes bacterium]|nr:cytochrome c3 family protein [Planctomycetota bacterium]
MSTSNPRILVAAGIAALVVLVGGGVFAYSRYKALPDPVTQPVLFNHKIHMDEKLGLTCDSCHKGVNEGPHATIPAVATCIKLCHTDPQGTSPEEPKLREAAAKGNAIPWIQVNKLPGHVYFSHVQHVKFAKMDCKECHGEMKDRTEPVSQTQTSRLDMDTCIDCHQEKGVSTDCLRCHK